MKILKVKYEHEESGIQFQVRFVEVLNPDISKPEFLIQKRIRVDSKDQKGKFTFDESKADTLIEVGKTFQEIGNFVNKL